MKVFKVDNQAQSELCWVLFVSFKRFLLFIFYHMNLNYTLSIPAASLPSVFNDVIISLNWLNFIETTWNRLKSYETVNTREGSMYKICVNELCGVDGHCCVTIKGRGRFQWQLGKKKWKQSSVGELREDSVGKPGETEGDDMCTWDMNLNQACHTCLGSGMLLSHNLFLKVNVKNLWIKFCLVFFFFFSFFVFCSSVENVKIFCHVGQEQGWLNEMNINNLSWTPTPCKTECVRVLESHHSSH